MYARGAGCELAAAGMPARTPGSGRRIGVLVHGKSTSDGRPAMIGRGATAGQRGRWSGSLGLLGVLAALSGSLALALVAGPGALRAAPGTLQINPEARDLFTQAMEQRRAHDIGRALDSYLRAYHADPSILALDDSGLLNALVQFLKAGLARDPTDISHTYKLAEVLALRGDLGEALDYYGRVQQLNPTSPLALAAKQEAGKINAELQATLTPSHPGEPEPSASAAAAGKTTSTTSAADWQSQVDGLNAKAQALQKQVDALQAQVDDDKQKLDDKDKQIDELNKKVIMYNNYRLGVLQPITTPK